MRIIGDTEDFNPGEILAAFKRSVVYKPQTTIEAKEILADWWEALSLELLTCRRETLTGYQNHRVTAEDTGHAEAMAVWLRWAAADERWSSDPDNKRALTSWDAVKPPSGGTKEEYARALALLVEADRERLKSRPRAPDKSEAPIARPRNYLPVGWPPIPQPLKAWSIYLGWLLAEKRARAGIREPGEDDDIEPAAEHQMEAHP